MWAETQKHFIFQAILPHSSYIHPSGVLKAFSKKCQVVANSLVTVEAFGAVEVRFFLMS